MKPAKLKQTIFYLLIFSAAFAKNDSIVKPQVRFSPIQIANLRTSENFYVKCTYGQPLKKGRTVFGGIVPYGKLWRTGANEATEITFTNHVKIKDKYLNAGTYTLFSIPNEKNWKIIINSLLGQWGDFSYDSTKNVLEIDVVPQRNENIYEGFTIEFAEQNKGISMHLMWDDLKVEVPFEYVTTIPNQQNNKSKRKQKTTK